jgi:hypothetical protein
MGTTIWALVLLTWPYGTLHPIADVIENRSNINGVFRSDRDSR